MRTKPQTHKTLRIAPVGVVPMWMMLLGPALLALAAVLLLAPQQPAEASDALSDYDKTVLADNPIAYFRLDGTNVTDLSPQNHDGSYVGAIRTTKLPNGEAATVFDGSS